MKFTSLQAFEKHLEGASPKHFSNLYMIVSKEPYECKHAASRLIAAILKEEPQPEICLKTFDCQHLNLNALLTELEAFSLFSKRQVIAVQNIEELSQQARSALESYITKSVPSLYLVLSGSSVNHATNFYKKAEKAGVILEIPELKPWEKERILADWVKKQAAEAGKSIDQQASQLLVKLTGTDQHTLHNELEKLYAYIGDSNRITSQDIDAICAHTSIDTVWQLGEAIFQRNGGLAWRIGKALLNDGTSFIALVKAIRSQFQTEFQVCSILANGGTGSDVAQRFPYMKGAILEKHLNRASGYGLNNFKTGMQLIDDTEVTAKNSSADHELLACMLIAKLTI